MDTSKKYINMCEKASEVQKMRKGDIWTVQMTDFNHVTSENKLIWLPRQDQLQGIVKFKSVTRKDDLWIKIEKFYQFVNSLSGSYSYSMEHLWLAFVMKEKFNKIWNGKEWTHV